MQGMVYPTATNSHIMDLSAIIKAMPAPSQERAADIFASLQPGDRLTGRVLRLESDGRVLIDLGRFRALAHTNLSVQPGQTLALKVVQKGIPVHLRIDTDKVLETHRPMPKMDLGGIISLKDMQRLPAMIDRLTARLDDKTLAALQRPVGAPTPGTGTGAPNPQNARSGVQPVGPTHQQPLERDVLLQAFARLKAVFEPMPVQRPVPELARWVQAAVEDGGLLFEKKVAELIVGRLRTETALAKRQGPDMPKDGQVAAQPGDAPSAPGTQTSPSGILARDLKPQLLVLKTFFNQIAPEAADQAPVQPKEVAVVRQAVEQLLAHVEQQQERAVQRSGEADLFHVFTHLLPMEEHHRAVRLKVYYPKQGRSEDQKPGHRIALLLDMDRLGPVRVDLAMIDKQLSIGFYVRDETMRQLFDHHIDAVAAALEPAFEEVLVATRVSAEKIARFDSEDLAGTAVGRIDIQA